MSDVTRIDSGPQGDGGAYDGIIARLLERITALEEWQSTHQGLDWGNYGINSPHPNASFDTAEYGGGKMRLDALGIQVRDTSNINGMAFVPSFVNTSPVTDPYPATASAVDGWSDGTQTQVQMINVRQGASTSLNTATLSWDGFQGVFNVTLDNFSMLDCIWIEASSTGTIFARRPIQLEQTNSDPPLPSGELEIWGRTDLHRPRIRINGITGNLAVEIQSSTAAAVASNGTISTAGVSCARVSPTGSVTGVILAAGTTGGQMCLVVNEAVAANTVTFAASGTSHVADGAASVVAGLNARLFVWDSSAALWYPCK